MGPPDGAATLDDVEFEDDFSDPLEPVAEAAPAPGRMEDLAKDELRRRMEELELIRVADTPQLPGSDACWVLLPTSWILEWTAYVTQAGPRPGVVRTHELLEPDNTPKPGLVKVKDYRAVNCAVYALYTEMYGTDCTPAVCRYAVDLYSPAVLGKFKEDALRGPLLEARIVAQDLRTRFEYAAMDEEDDDPEDRCCCCLTKSCVENWIYRILTCGKHFTAPARYSRLPDMDDEGEEEDVDEEEEEAFEGPDSPSSVEMTRLRPGAKTKAKAKATAKQQRRAPRIKNNRRWSDWVAQPGR